MKKLLLGIVALGFLIGLNACAMVGTDFTTHQIGQLEEGVTTKAEVESILGEPFKEGIQNGQPIWVYEFNYYHFLGDNTSKDLVITFNDQGIVEAYQVMTNRPSI